MPNYCLPLRDLTEGIVQVSPLRLDALTIFCNNPRCNRGTAPISAALRPLETYPHPIQ